MSHDEDCFSDYTDEELGLGQRCASSPCEDFERTQSNDWPIGPSGVCAGCAHTKALDALEQQTRGIDESSEFFKILDRACDEFVKAGPQIIVDGWKAERRMLATMRKALVETRP